MITTQGDTIEVDGVTELRGRVDWVTPDSLYLRLSGLSGRSRNTGPVRANALVAVARNPDVLIQQPELHTGRTLALMVGSLVLTAGLGLVVFMLTFQPG